MDEGLCSEDDPVRDNGHSTRLSSRWHRRHTLWVLLVGVVSVAVLICRRAVTVHGAAWDVEPSFPAVSREGDQQVELALVPTAPPAGKRLWCIGPPNPPELWEPNLAEPGVSVKVLSYNVFWWNIFVIRKGNHNSIGKLIKSAMNPPFDVMGFQECSDFNRVLVGLLDEYMAFQGTNGVCMAYRKATWEMLTVGQTDVAEDSRLQFYGRRTAQWMRLKHKGTGKIVFFMNHHGPLPVNSGGLCGGRNTAINLMMLIQQNGQTGDSIILVGDFNAGEGSQTLATLEKKLVRAYTTGYLGGIDNLFTNVRNPTRGQDLGNGGSDHDALSAFVELRPLEKVAPLPPGSGLKPPRVKAPPPKDRGQCQCKCEWAAHQDSCDDDDATCCWLQCCSAVKPVVAHIL